MSFTPGIPASGQSLGSSRTQVQDNFSSLRSTLAANHVDVNSANPGLHTHADLLAQSADPNPATGIVSHYSKLVSGNTEWFFQRENTGPIIQMSNLAGTPSVGSSGRTFLPGGLILIWGQCNYNTASSTTVTFQGSGFPTACLSVQLTPFVVPGSSPITLIGNTFTTTTFAVQAKISSGSASASPGAFYWAIGN